MWFDGVSTIFAVLTLAAALYERVATWRSRVAVLLAAVVLLLTYHLAACALGAAGYLLATLLLLPHTLAHPTAAPAVRRALLLLWLLLPCACLWLAAALLQQAGAVAYHDPAFTTSLNSTIFWFLLLATLSGSGIITPMPSQGRSTPFKCRKFRYIPLRCVSRPHPPCPPLPAGEGYTHKPRMRRKKPTRERRTTPQFIQPGVLAIAWFYPLVRLASATEWNRGWHSALLLLGSGAALWFAWQAVAWRGTALRAGLLLPLLLALALASVGTGTGAGVAACCCLLLVVPLLAPWRAPPGGAPPVITLHSLPPTAAALLVAAWMGMSAALLAGVAGLVGVLWVGLLVALTTLLEPMCGAARGTVWQGVWAVGSGGLALLATLVVVRLLWPLQVAHTSHPAPVPWPWGVLLPATPPGSPLLPALVAGCAALAAVLLAWLWAGTRARTP